MTLRNLRIPFHIRILNSLDELRDELDKSLERLSAKNPFFCFDPILYRDKNLISLRENIEKHAGSLRCALIEDSRLETAQQAQREALESRADIIIAIGGGKCLDVAKYSAAQLGIPFAAIPTQAAHDGICSPVAVLQLKDITYSLPARSPESVLINLPTILNSPRRSLSAGIGDLLSNITAVKDWELSEEKQGEKFDDFAALLASLGPESLTDSANPDLSNPEFVEKLVKGLILSGIAMEIAGSSRPCSGGEHQISHAMDQLFPGRNALHGEQVAFGTLVSCVLWDHNPAFMKDFLMKFGLPVKLSDLNFSKSEFSAILDKAPATRPGRWTILNEVAGDWNSALTRLDKFGILD